MSHKEFVDNRLYNWIPTHITLPPRLFGLFLMLVLWTFVASIFPAGLMSYPWDVVSNVIGLFYRGVVFSNLWVTLLATTLGFFGALLIGGFLGVILGSTTYGKQFLTPYIVLGLSIPGVAWAAAATISLGLTIWAPITASMLTVAPFIAISIWKGVESIDRDLIQMSSSFGVKNRRILSRFILPSIAPALFSSTRFGIAISWKVVTIAEIFAASEGIGYSLMQSYTYYRFDDVWAWAAVFFMVILIFEYGIFRPIERRVYNYRPDTDIDII